jgi:hypothetical protein
LTHFSFAQLLAVIAAYWLLVLALGIAAVRLMRAPTITKRLAGLVVLVGTCILVFTTIFRPEIDDWRLNESTTSVRPPRAMVLRSAAPQIEIIAAFFVTTGLFDVFVAPPGEGWLDRAAPIVVRRTKDCGSEGAQASQLSIFAAKCIQRQDSVPLPACRIQIDLDGSPPSVGDLAQRAQIYVVTDGEQPCPFFGPKERIRLPDPLGRSLPRFILGDPPPWSSLRLYAELTSPTSQSILRAIGIAPDSFPRSTFEN